MIGERAARAPASAPPAEPGGSLDDGWLGRAWFPFVVFVAIACVLVVVAWVSVANLSLADIPKTTGPRWRAYPDQPWLDGWARFDSGWYAAIARVGYIYSGHGQSPAAFFPAYPLAMRALGVLVGDETLSGMLITFASGLGVAVVFFSWCRAQLGSARAARYALAALLLYPFAYYLVAAVYGDAFFILMTLLAFAALERDEPVLAGLAGAFATAARPVGGAVVLGLVVRALERRGAFDGLLGRHREAVTAPRTTIGPPPVGAPGRRLDLRSVPPRDYAVLLSAGGLVAYCVWLWGRFGDPFAFASAMEGWKQPAGLATWLKYDVWRAFGHPSPYLLRSLLHAGLALGALLLVPRVVRRLGWGYGVYAFTIVFFPALSTKDFVGMARYVLAAFPCFAVAGLWLAEHPKSARPVLAASGIALVLLTSFYARWYYLS